MANEFEPKVRHGSSGSLRNQSLALKGWKTILFYLFLLLPIPVFVFSLSLGRYPITWIEVVQVFFSGLFNTGSDYPSMYYTVVFDMRLPRILIGLMVGASLSVSGATFQGIFRNPLVGPYVLGISSGAAFGAALSLAIFPQLPVQLCAFSFSLAGLMLAYLLTRSKGETLVTSMVLAGIVISSVFGALLTIIQMMVDEKALQSIIYWTMGSLNTATWSKMSPSWIIISASCTVIFVLRWKLNVLTMGDAEAKSVGMNTELYKGIFILASTLAASSAVSIAGIIGLVGLIVPHTIRMIFGPDHRTLIPLSITVGAAFMILVDDIARSLMGFEIPVGVITTMIGAPFFMYALRSTRAGGWD